jgi:hypothetical protein
MIVARGKLFGTAVEISSDGPSCRAQVDAKPARRRGTDDDALSYAMTMTSECDHVRKLTHRDGHTATFTYALAKEGGWEVRAEIDERTVAIRHCIEWHRVERLHEWLLRQV